MMPACITFTKTCKPFLFSLIIGCVLSALAGVDGAIAEGMNLNGECGNLPSFALKGRVRDVDVPGGSITVEGETLIIVSQGDGRCPATVVLDEEGRWIDISEFRRWHKVRVEGVIVDGNRKIARMVRLISRYVD